MPKAAEVMRLYLYRPAGRQRNRRGETREVLDPRQVELLLGRIRAIRDLLRNALIASTKDFAEPLDNVGWNGGHFEVSWYGLTLIGWFPSTTAALLFLSVNHILHYKLILATAGSSWQYVFVVNSGYRTRYPHVAVATNHPTDEKMDRA